MSSWLVPKSRFVAVGATDGRQPLEIGVSQNRAVVERDLFDAATVVAVLIQDVDRLPRAGDLDIEIIVIPAQCDVRRIDAEKPQGIDLPRGMWKHR